MQSLEPLLEVGRLLSSQLDLGKLLKTVLELGAKVVGAETASLLLLDQKTQELYFHTALDLGDKVAGVRLKLGQGIAGTVAKERKPAIINDAKSDPRWSKSMDDSTGFKTRSILAVPLVFQGQLIGVIEALNKREGVFTEEDVRTFEAFASQSAVAIENARLFSSLKDEKRKLDTVFTEMTDGAILVDSSGSVALTNGAVLKLLGGEAPPPTLDDALDGFGMTPSLHEAMAGDKSSVGFMAAREKPKKLVLSGKLNRLENGWLCVLRDVTEEWNKERLKRTFLSLISHKLKTPLAAIIGFSEILEDDVKDNPGAYKAALTIGTQGRKLGNLVDKLLRYVEIENPDATVTLEPIKVDALVADALKELQSWLTEQKGVVDYKGAPDASLVGDKERLRDVVKNLVENAVKFDAKPEKKVSARAESRNGWISISVQDSGCGIPPEDQKKVFSQFHQVETFFTGQMEGWGLGLPYVKKVIENHGGQVSLESVPGKGTTVTVTLPCKPG